MTLSQSSPPTCTWRPGDSEALRVALAIPVTPAALRALEQEMVALQVHYPTGVCSAQKHLDRIAALEQQLLALTAADALPVRVRRKGVVGGVVPEPLPYRKLDVVELATELLVEESESEWSPDRPGPAVVLQRQRQGHGQQLQLLFPRLALNWSQVGSDPFQGRLERG